MLTTDLYKAAIKKYGATAQENMCIEECAELIQAINKKHRGLEHNIAEEIADVEIVLAQLKTINACWETVATIKQVKMRRLAASLQKNENTY
jgi:NTP pyrophosphatase (non-canonical NTP hydrolase)